jgi:hypothetical protein
MPGGIMFCPECRYEYRREFTECPDCNVALVHKLPPKTTPEPVDFKEVFSTYNFSDIAIIKSVFDAEEINYTFRGEHLSNLLPILEPARLMVDATQARKAIDILSELGISERPEP